MPGIHPDDPDYKYLCVDKKDLMQLQTVPFDGKKNCWVPDEKLGFVAAEIQSSKGDDITVKTVEKMDVSLFVFVYHYCTLSKSIFFIIIILLSRPNSLTCDINNLVASQNRYNL